MTSSSSGYFRTRFDFLVEEDDCGEFSAGSVWLVSVLFSLGWFEEVFGARSSTDPAPFDEGQSVPLEWWTMVRVFFELPGSLVLTTVPVVWHSFAVALDKETSCIKDFLAFSAKSSVWDSALHMSTAGVCDELWSKTLDRATEQISMCSGCEQGWPVNKMFILRYRGKVKVLFTVKASISWNYKTKVPTNFPTWWIVIWMYALDPLFYDFKRLYKLIFDIMFSTLISYNENGAFESQIDEITQISQKLRFFF